ncbi:MAG: efflux RND transporter permease subunit, partial [Acidimicrobiia bacterium]|nr:efflux RND transporter permease subunit [Acidimicrobiia bacterium]
GFPSVAVPITVARGTYFVDDPEIVDIELAQPMVAALIDRPEIESVDSTAGANFVTVVASLTDDLTSEQGAEIIDAEVAALDLPPEADVTTQALDVAKFFDRFDLLVGVYGPVDADASSLEAAAESLLGLLQSQPEVAEAEVLDLLQSGINPATGEEVVNQTRFNQITTPSSTDGGSGVEFRSSIAVGVIAAEGTDGLAIRDGVDRALASPDLDRLLPDGYQAVVAVDFATAIRQQIASLQGNVLTGLVAVTIIALLLISWRSSIITALFIGTVLATAFGVLYLFGISLNTISLFGMILALGLFVDDAIVITEAIETFREGRSDPIDVIRHAIRRVGAASISGTVTTVLVFAPMLAISGILGEFIRILPISVIVALVTSLTLSLLFIPIASRFLVLSAPRSRALLGRAENWLADEIGSAADVRGRRGLVIAAGAVGLSVAALAIAVFGFLPRVGFDIFPAAKDSIEISGEYTFPPGTTIEQAEALTSAINADVLAALSDTLTSGNTYVGNAGRARSQFNLTDIGSRPPAPELIARRLDPLAADHAPVQLVFNQVSAGPPVALFPFRVQVNGEEAETLAAAARQIAEDLDGSVLERANGTTFTVLETKVVSTDVVARRDGNRYVEVQARFDADDVTTTTAETRSLLEDRYGPDELAALGLGADALRFDFGIESDNQESFASMGPAFVVALLAMMVLLIIQFRSTVQWLLVFLAIPFSLFGVFGGLLLTDNKLSFFVMLGLLGLIGIAVNNTILLTDFANQERRAGADRRTAISTAVRRRFRPLVATTLTTVAGVLPLTLSDPFWEPLGYTIIFGLLSSTVLVLVAFPYYYLAMERVRDRFVTPWRRTVT